MGLKKKSIADYFVLLTGFLFFLIIVNTMLHSRDKLPGACLGRAVQDNVGLFPVICGFVAT